MWVQLISGSGRSSEKEMETHSSIVARKITLTVESGGLQSMESHRGGHDGAIEHMCMHTHTHTHTHMHTWSVIYFYPVNSQKCSFLYLG